MSKEIRNQVIWIVDTFQYDEAGMNVFDHLKGFATKPKALDYKNLLKQDIQVKRYGLTIEIEECELND